MMTPDGCKCWTISDFLISWMAGIPPGFSSGTRDQPWQQHSLSFSIFALLGLLGTPATAQIATDGTTGPQTNLAGPDFRIGAELGTTRGANLFHSFQTFNVHTDESATFTGPDTLHNVISRVTGGEASSIDGLLRSEVGQADFYFINPAGVVFGPEARVDVPAGFHVGTATEVRFEDGNVYSATNPGNSTLSISAPESFGFLSPQPASLEVNGSQLDFAPNSHVSMAAGNVTIQGAASLVGDGVDIQITAVGDSGNAVPLATDPADFTYNGMIAITEFSAIDVSGTEGSETIALRGGLVEIADSVIAADHRGSVDSAGHILFEADRVRVINSDIRAQVFGAGRGNDIVVVAEDLEVDAATALDGRSRLATRVKSLASGKAGNVRVEAARVSLTNGGQLSSIVEEGAMGPGGMVEVRARDSVLIEGSNGAGIFSGIGTTTLSGADAAGGPIVIDSPAASVRIAEGGFLQSGSAGAGQAGDIKITVKDLEINEGSVIDSRTFGSGNGGMIQLSAVDTAIISDSALFAATNGFGDAGSITISAAGIELRQGELNVNTSNTGKAGEIRLEARDSVILTNSSEIQAFSGISSTESRLGDAGNISIKTGSLSVVDSSIDVFSSSRSNAGTIEVSADEIHVDNTGDETLTAFNASNIGGSFLAPGSELVTTEEGRSGTIVLDASKIVFDHGANISINTNAGDGGSVIVQADEVSLLNGATVLSNTTGPGRGGEVQIDVSGTFLIKGGFPENGFTLSGGISTSPLVLDLPGSSSETGPSGVINVTAGTLIVGQDGQILSDSFSNAPAGPITLEIGTLEVRDGGEISSSVGAEGSGANIVIIAQEAVSVHGADPVILIDPSEISVDAGFLNPNTGGDGGSIRIEAPVLMLEQGGVLSSETGSTGKGGVIEVLVNDLVIQSGGEINTSTFGAGRGGRINIVAESVSIRGEGADSLNPLLQETGLFSRTVLGATGGAGTIDIAAETTMELLSGARISTGTGSAGNAGTIDISAEELLIDSDLSDRQVSTITSRAEPGATGTVGTVKITADSLIINQGEISITANQTLPADRLGSESEGFIRIDAEKIHLDRGTRITAESTGNVPASTIEIHTEDLLLMETESRISTASNEADSGPIQISGDNLVLRDSLITTSVQGTTGDGGDIDLNATALVLQGGFIQANTAAAQASGGDIFIDTPALIASGNRVEIGGTERLIFQPGSGRNVIQAAAPAGNPGNISITSPELDISGTLIILSTRFVDAARLISDPCAAAGEATSSLVQRGHEGLPADPEQPAAVSFGGDRLDRLLESEAEQPLIKPPVRGESRSYRLPADLQRAIVCQRGP